MTSKELTELIHQNTRIILPNFGAFLVKDGGDKGFVPTNVSFSPFLRYNDGMIEIYVAKSRGISKEEASKVVFEFVENIKNELLEKGVFEVEGLGFLNRDQRGSLTFSLSQKSEKKAAIAKDEPDIIIKKETDIPQQIVVIDHTDDKNDAWLAEDKPQSDEDADNKPKKIARTKAKVEKLTTTKKSTKSTKTVEEPVTNEVESVKQDIINEVKSEPTFVLEGEPEKSIEIEPTIQVSTPNMNEKLIEIEKNEPEVLSKQEPKSDNYTVEVINVQSAKKSYKGLIYTIITLCVLVALFFLLRNYYFPPKIETSNSEALNSKAPETIIKDDAEVKDKIEKPKDDIDKAYNQQSEYDKFVEEQKEKEKKQEEAIANKLIENAKEKEKVKQNSISNGIRYYVIAGSFKNAENAKSFANNLKKLGYNAGVEIQTSGMNAVHIGSYATHDEASKAMNEFKSKLKNLWILKK